jgi:hypothetical protein
VAMHVLLDAERIEQRHPFRLQAPGHRRHRS